MVIDEGKICHIKRYFCRILKRSSGGKTIFFGIRFDIDDYRTT